MGSIFRREAAAIGIIAVSLAALLTVFPLQPAGYAASAASGASLKANEPGPQVTVTLSSYGFEQCRDELVLCMNSVSELSDMVLNRCDKPHHEFELAAWEVAKSHEYSEDKFNCNAFSELLAQNLGGLGYSARVVHGYYKGEPHTWVVAEIPIEATSGNLITPQSYADYKMNE